MSSRNPARNRGGLQPVPPHTPGAHRTPEQAIAHYRHQGMRIVWWQRPHGYQPLDDDWSIIWHEPAHPAPHQ